MRLLAITIHLTISFCCLKAFSQTPYMQSCLINSCNGSCNEGNNEIIFLNTGASSVLVNSANVSISYGNVVNPPTNYTNASLVTNVATTTTLNTTAGCTPVLLIEATNTIVPPNSLILVVQNGICANSLNWPGLCPIGPIYITYSNDADWLPAGNFSNGTGTLRHFRTAITNTLGVTTTIDYNYTLPAGFGNDGAFATWSNAGGAASSYGDNDCILSPTILPVSLKSFNGFPTENNNVLTWDIEREINNDFYELERSLDGLSYEKIAKIYPNKDLIYTYEDEFLQAGYIYYKLYQTDKNGARQFLDKIVLYRKNTHEVDLFPNPTSGSVQLRLADNKRNKLNEIILLSNTGKEMFKINTQIDENKEFETIQLESFQAGVYYFQFIFEDKIEVRKIILQ